MDIFKRMAQGTTTDFGVFKSKNMIKEPVAEPTKEEEKKATETNPFPQQSEESVNAEPFQTGDANTGGEPPKKEEAPKLDEQDEEQMENSKKAEPETGKVIQFRQPESPNEEASIKLEAELETAKNTLLPVFPIVRYLKSKCMADGNFAALVLDERKTLGKCFDYVMGEVKKALNSQNGWLDDTEVYAYAETYYMTSEEELERISAEKAEAEKKRREEVEKKRKEQEEKRIKAAKQNKKKRAASEKVKAGITNEVDSIPESKSEPEQEAKNTPVLQEQLCLDM